ncbi:MAG: lytic murein transglycosylase [Bauldia sp.]
MTTRAIAIGRALLVGLIVALGGETAWAGPECHDGASFEQWLAAFRQNAVASGISRTAVSAALDGVTFDRGIIDRDHRQGIFADTFLEFSDKVVPKSRLTTGAAKLAGQAGLFRDIEARFGVPGAVLVAMWGLESDFGVNMGKLSSIRSLATLAYDCRRTEMFSEELMAAVRIVERGDLRPADMLGSWAGELGQTQFMPTEYMRSAIDFDGDGKRNLLRSSADALASAANYLVGLGWKRGEPWLEEVRVPAKMAWEEADVAIRHPRSYWAAAGVTLANGNRLPADATQTSLILPMGRLGPAFLAYGNYEVFQKWNSSLVYSTTLAYFATRLAGAPAVNRGSVPAAGLTAEQAMELQRQLTRRGFDVGPIDGKIGLGTRAAVKQVQLKLGLPADSYPTPELLARMRAG